MIFHIFIPADMDRLIQLVRDFLALIRQAHGEKVMTAEFKQEADEEE